MARTRTLVQLRAEVRDRADIENSQHITDAQITRYVNQSGAALHALMVEEAEDYFVTATGAASSAPVDGATEFPAPSAFYKLIVVEATINGRIVRIPRFQWQQHARLTDTNNAPGPPYFYRLIQSTIYITPGLTTGTNVRIYYVPAYVDLVADADTYDGRDGWEEWVVIDAAVKCLIKEESDTRALVAERTEVMNRLMTQMKNRDLGRPDRVQDVTGRDWYDDEEIRAGRLAPP